MLKSDVLIDDGKPWSMRTLSAMTGLTTQKIKKMISNGLPYSMEGNVYLFDSKKTIKWIIEHEVNKALPLNVEGYINVGEAKRRFEVAKALQAELELAKSREEVANIEDLMLNFADALVQVRAKLVGQPSRLAGIMSHQDEDICADILEKDITETLEILSNYDHRYIENESGSETENSETDNRNNPPIVIPAPKVKPR